MLSGTAYRSVTLIVADCSRIVRIIEALIIDNYTPTEVGAFYWTDLTPDIVNSGREEQGSISL